ncbi:LysE family translocator [Aeromonas hydrophila]
MQAYLMFIAMAGLTILSPGPSTLKSLTNALNHGLGPALVGMAGLTCGVLGVATLSATSLGVLLATSPTAFEWVRYGGVLYLAWLGVKLWRSPPPRMGENPPSARHRLFWEGVMLQFTNPNALIFFLSILPQFIDHRHAYLPQFLLLVSSFCLLMVLVHGGYIFSARKARRWLQGGGGRWINRLGALAFGLLAMVLLRG